MDPRLDAIEHSFRRVYSQLDPGKLQGRAAAWPSGEALAQSETCNAAESFLGFYCVQGLQAALEEYGLLSLVRARGYEGLLLSLSRDHEDNDVLSIRAKDTPVPLIELVATLGGLPEDARITSGLPEGRYLHIRYLRMQDPHKVPDPSRRLMPGQRYPGLGIGREMMALVQMMCARLDLDGIWERPERLHNAALYFHRFLFLDPVMQGTLTAILRDTRHTSLPHLAWACESNSLIESSSRRPLTWLRSVQVLARRNPTLAYLQSSAYRDRVRATMDALRFSLRLSDENLERSLGVDAPMEIPDIDIVPNKK